MKVKLLILILVLTMSCSSGSIYRELFNSISILFETPKDISNNEVEKIPYDVMQVRLGRSKNILIVLEEVKDDILKWTSSNQIKVYTKNGLIVRLTGLENELDLLELDKNHPFNTNQFNINDKLDLLSFYTFKHPNLFRLPIKTKFYFLRSENIDLLGNTIETNLFVEEAQKNLINWEFSNFYWISDQNEVLKSIQSFTPLNEEMHLKMLSNNKKPE